MANPELTIPREKAETAAPVREVAEDRTFTEGEAYALVADNVKRETASRDSEIASLTEAKSGLEAEKAQLQTDLDVAVAAKEKAEKDLADYKAEVEHKAEVAVLAKAREAKVREVAAHLKDDFFTAERTQRWAEMAEADFDSYVAELAAVATPAAAVTPPAAGEHAALGTTVTGEPVTAVASKSFFTIGRGNR